MEQAVHGSLQLTFLDGVRVPSTSKRTMRLEGSADAMVASRKQRRILRRFEPKVQSVSTRGNGHGGEIGGTFVDVRTRTRT